MSSTAMPRIDRDPAVPFVAEQIAQQDLHPAEERRRARQRRARTMRPILWRLHFLGGFLAGPVVISLALTGILFAWNPQLDDLRFGGVMQASGGAGQVPLSEQVEAAQNAHPDWTVYSVTPAYERENTAVVMDPPGGEAGRFGPPDAVTVYVDPSTGLRTGDIAGTDTSDSILRSLHSSWRLGPDFEPLTELAGSWFLVTLFTGLYLWWPGLRRRGRAAFGFRRGLRDRLRNKEFHNAIGLAFFVPMVLLAITGLTWTQYAGDRVDLAKNGLSVAPLAADTQIADPVAGQADLASIDVVARRAAEEGLVEPFAITLPRDDAAAWKVASNDVTFPVERDQLAVNGSTGDVVDRVDYSDEHWFNKLTTAGVLFHQAQLFGLPLQVFMTVLALAVVTMIVFGYRMWWQRRPKQGFGTPPPVRDWVRSAPLTVLLLAVVLGWAMPVLGLSLALWLVVESGWRSVQSLRSAPPSASTSASSASASAVTGAGVLLVLGVAMLAVPALGEGGEEPLSTFLRALAWAWSRPVGALLLIVGLLGLLAATRRRWTPAGPGLPAAKDAKAADDGTQLVGAGTVDRQGADEVAREPAVATRVGRLVPLAGLAVVLALIGGLVLGEGMAAPNTTVSDNVSIGFLRDMKTHHAQAVQMSTIVHRRSPDPALNYLAEDILTTQQGQIGIMMGYLSMSGQSQSGNAKVMAWMGSGHAGIMPGMATDADVEALKTLPLPQMQEQYLRLMIRHHRGGIPMAQYAADNAGNPEVASLAQSMATGQAAEIQAMQDMLVAAGLPTEPDDSSVDGSSVDGSGRDAPAGEPAAPRASAPSGHGGHGG